MITIKTWEHGAVITGHAGYAPIGYDIVCASISALFCNLVYSLQELTGARIRYKMDAGQSYIVYKNGGEGAELLNRSFLLGVTEIAGAYPENVRVTRLERQ